MSTDKCPFCGKGKDEYPKCAFCEETEDSGETMANQNSFEELIKEHAEQFCKTEDSVCFKPDIPEKKLNNAIKSYANEVDPSNVTALFDGTVLGSAKEGFLITLAGFYSKDSDARFIDFNAIQSVNLEQTDVPKIKKCLMIHLKDGMTQVYGEDNPNLKIEEFQTFLEKVTEYREQGLINETDKFIIVEDMPDSVKVNYVKAVVQMTLEDDGVIDEDELAEIQVLVTQLNFEPELRHEIRQYVANPCLTIDDILSEMDQDAPKGSEHVLHISLLKDMIRVHRATKGEVPFRDREFIVSVAERYEIADEQLEVIEQACIYDEMIVAGKVDDNMIIKNAKELASKAGAVGIPIAAVYLSGSVAGLSAAGITSGLAALGLGGVLGFSSMVTGIGAAVLIGVGAYKGIQWLAGGSKREKVSKREFMIQEVIKLNQKTITNLAEDINFFGLKIVESARESEINEGLIEKLGKELTVFSNALGVLKAKGIDLEGVLNEAK